MLFINVDIITYSFNPGYIGVVIFFLSKIDSFDYLFIYLFIFFVCSVHYHYRTVLRMYFYSIKLIFFVHLLDSSEQVVNR